MKADPRISDLHRTLAQPPDFPGVRTKLGRGRDLPGSHIERHSFPFLCLTSLTLVFPQSFQQEPPPRCTCSTFRALFKSSLCLKAKYFLRLL